MKSVTRAEVQQAIAAFLELSRKKCFFMIPNMGMIHSEFSQILFHSMQDPSLAGAWWMPSGNRHHDFARNVCVREFLKSDREFLVFMDADCPPPTLLVELVRHELPVISGAVFCMLRSHQGEDMLLPSLWKRAKCEQCRCLDVWVKEKKVHDPREYRVDADDPGGLQRWNPFRQWYEPFAGPDGLLPGVECRCKGTGKDPWVYNFDPRAISESPYEIDSCGGAAMVIRRDVLEKLPFPQFMFLYRESREILLTEDHYFCWQAKEAGFPVYAHTGVVSGHIKEIDLAVAFKVMDANVKKAVKRTRELIVEELRQKTAAREPLIATPTLDEVRAITG